MKTSHPIALLLATLLASCKPAESVGPAASATIATTPAVTVPAAVTTNHLSGWLGRWTGPEGTFLQLEAKGSGYAITLQSLDGPAQYEGTAAGDHISFERGGTTETIRASDGKGTGMKWLQEKTDCLTIRPGEGFCRN